MTHAKRLLIIDSVFYDLARRFRDLGFDVIETGPVKNAFDAIAEIHRYKNGLDFIILNILLREDREAGDKIIKLLPEYLKEKLIGVGDKNDGCFVLKVIRFSGIKHAVFRNPEEILKCIKQECECGKNS